VFLKAEPCDNSVLIQNTKSDHANFDKKKRCYVTLLQNIYIPYGTRVASDQNVYTSTMLKLLKHYSVQETAAAYAIGLLWEETNTYTCCTNLNAYRLVYTITMLLTDHKPALTG
jgi:hypothetical protein